MALLQIIVSLILIALILLQQRDSGMSGLLGGGDSFGGIYQARRGAERMVFYSTIALAIIFVALSVYQLFAK
jgi:protein translocase SecG subunit